MNGCPRSNPFRHKLASPRQIDLEELMKALKHERSAVAVLNKDDKRQQPQQDAGDSDERTVIESAMMPLMAERGDAEAEEVVGVGSSADKEEKAVFPPEEAGSLTTYLVESQQAFSLLNVADIQHGEGV